MNGRRMARVTERTLYRDLNGDAVLLQLDTGEYYGLDNVAHRMWQLLSEKRDLEQVRAVLLAEFDVDAGQLSQDLEHFVEELVDCQLLKVEVVSADPGV